MINVWPKNILASKIYSTKRDFLCLTTYTFYNKLHKLHRAIIRWYYTQYCIVFQYNKGNPEILKELGY